MFDLGPLLLVFAALVGLTLAIAIRPWIGVVLAAPLLLAALHLALAHPARPAEARATIALFGFGLNASLCDNLLAPPLAICAGTWLIVAMIRALVRRSRSALQAA